MHLSEPVAGDITANLLHSSAAVTVPAPSKQPETALALSTLLLQPIWGPEHLKVLRVKEKNEVFASVIVGRFNLPRDGHDDFEQLSTDLTLATISDITHLPTTSTILNFNPFMPLYTSLHALMIPSQTQDHTLYFHHVKALIQSLLDPILAYTDSEGCLRVCTSSLPFHLHLPSLSVNGYLPCDGSIIRTDMSGNLSPIPVTTFSITPPQSQSHSQSQKLNTTANTTSQLLLQAALAYEQDSSKLTYKTFTVHVEATTLQIASAEIPRAHLERWFKGRAAPEGFEVLRSPVYELLEESGRREALRICFGLLKAVRSRSTRRAF